MSTKQLTAGARLRVARATKNISQADLAYRSGIQKWRIVEAELDRLRLRDEELGAIERVLTGRVEKTGIPKSKESERDEKVQKAFDEVEALIKRGGLSLDDQRTIALKVMKLRRALGIDGIRPEI